LYIKKEKEKKSENILNFILNYFKIFLNMGIPADITAGSSKIHSWDAKELQHDDLAYDRAIGKGGFG
jgi:hypothetical protein